MWNPALGCVHSLLRTLLSATPTSRFVILSPASPPSLPGVAAGLWAGWSDLSGSGLGRSGHVRVLGGRVRVRVRVRDMVRVRIGREAGVRFSVCSIGLCASEPRCVLHHF